MRGAGQSMRGAGQSMRSGWAGRHKTISMWDSFHGASLDAISVGGGAQPIGSSSNLSDR